MNDDLQLGIVTGAFALLFLVILVEVLPIYIYVTWVKRRDRKEIKRLMGYAESILDIPAKGKA